MHGAHCLELHHELGVRSGAVVSLSRSTWILTASQEGIDSSLLNMLSWVNEIKDCEKAIEMLAVTKQQLLIYSGKCHSSKICQMLFLVVFQRPFNVLHPSVWLLSMTGVKRKYFSGEFQQYYPPVHKILIPTQTPMWTWHPPVAWVSHDSIPLWV